jgi:hypothetical protein
MEKSKDSKEKGKEKGKREGGQGPLDYSYG